MLRALPISLYLLVCAGLIVGNIVVYRVVFAPHTLKVTTFRTGEGLPAGRQGIATLVRAPDATVLIDTGSDASILRALGTELPFSQRYIDVVILTDTHASTTGGLPFVQGRYRVGAVAHTGDRIQLDSRTTVDATPTGVFLSDGQTVTKIR
jgi:glyoxylase-like metal-dependent hydrolase (beta-lactamase superfamily II)